MILDITQNQIAHETEKAILYKWEEDGRIKELWIPKLCIKNNWRGRKFIDVDQTFFNKNLK